MSTKIGTAASYTALWDALDAFLTSTGHAWGLRLVGTGNGRLRGPGGTVGGYLGTATSVTETITITFTSPTSANVVGSVSGSLGTATVGADFASSKIVFRIEAGSTPFVAGDFFTVNTGPKWQRLRWGGCPDSGMRTGTYSNVQNLFDDNWSSGAISATTVPQQVTVGMFGATAVRAFSLGNGATAIQSPSAFALQWSDDGSTWTTAQAYTGITWASTYLRKDFVLAADPGAHLYWRLNVTASNSGTTTQLSEFRLWADAAMKLDVSTRFEFAWQAPGVDGTQQIYVAGFSYTEPSNDAWNMAFRGFRFWQDPAMSIVNIPDNSGSKYLYLAKTPIAYWFVVNGGRVMIVTRISGIYQLAYVGFGLPYETPAIHPFPYLVGAPGTNGSYRWDSTGTSMIRNPSDPATTSSTSSTPASCTLAAMFPNGQFEGIANRYPSSNTAEGGSASGGQGKTWPYALGIDGGLAMDQFRDSIDGSKPLLPIVIECGSSPFHTWGEFDGVYWTTGFGNAAEAIIRDAALDCMVLPNVYRTSLNSFCAVALD